MSIELPSNIFSKIDVEYVFISVFKQMYYPIIIKTISVNGIDLTVPRIALVETILFRSK